MKWKLNIESPLVSGMMTASDLLILNCLWILTSLPVVTIGASTAALYRVVLDMHLQADGGNIKRFFRAWKENWKQATMLWLPTLAVLVLFFFVFQSFEILAGSIGFAIKLLLCLVTLVTLMINAYGYAYMCFFEDKLITVAKNAFGLAVQKLPITAGMVLINMAPLILLVLSAQLFMILLIFWLLIGVALSSYINAKMIFRIFNQTFLNDSELI